MPAAPRTSPDLSAVGLPAPAISALERVRAGQGALLLVAGGPRGARAELLRTIETVAGGGGWETVRLRAHPLDRGVPYGALHPWLSRWYSQSPHGKPETEANPKGRYTMPLVGLIASLPSVAGPRGGEGGEERTSAAGAPPSASSALAPLGPPLSPQMLRAELTELVEGRTRERSAVVTVEDAEFLDAASRLWLSFLGGRVGKFPIAVVLALDAEEPAFAAWQEQFGGEGSTWLQLPGRGGAAWRGALQARLSSLPARTQEALLAVVLAGPDASHDLVRSVVGGSDADLFLALSPAMDAGLLQRSDGRYEMLEPALFPDLLGTVAGSQLSTMHRALARELEMRQRGGSLSRGPPLFRLSDHWARAGEIARGVPALQTSAREAERWGAPELAEEKLMAAVVLTQTDPTAHGREVEERILAELAGLLFRAGRPTDSAQAYRRAIALAQQRGARAIQWARYESGLADAETRMGGHPEERLKSTLSQVEGRSSDIEALVLRSLAFYYVERGRTNESITRAERACELAEKGRDTVLKIRCHTTASTAYIFGGNDPEKAREHLLRALKLGRDLEGSPEQGVLVNVLDGLSLVECSLGNEAQSIRWGEESLQAAREYGYGTTLLLVLGNLPEHYVHSGNFARSEELTEELQRHVERLGLPEQDNSRSQLLLVQGRIAAGRGDAPTAKQRLTHLVELAEKGGGRYFLGQALVHLVVLSAKEGDRESAHRYLRRLEREGLLKGLVGENRRLLDEVEPLLGADVTGRSP